MVETLIRKVESIGNHPAILMWGLGNEVHLDEPYLRVVNRMSQEIHKRFPQHITSLTMINAKPEAITAVKKFAPDLDVLGIQSYSRGAVRGAIKKTEELWGKPPSFSAATAPASAPPISATGSKNSSNAAASTSPDPAIYGVIPVPRICTVAELTSATFKNCLAMPGWKRRGLTPTSTSTPSGKSTPAAIRTHDWMKRTTFTVSLPIQIHS
jgi:hypothetical protein